MSQWERGLARALSWHWGAQGWAFLCLVLLRGQLPSVVSFHLRVAWSPHHILIAFLTATPDCPPSPFSFSFWDPFSLLEPLSLGDSLQISVPRPLLAFQPTIPKCLVDISLRNSHPLPGISVHPCCLPSVDQGFRHTPEPLFMVAFVEGTGIDHRLTQTQMWAWDVTLGSYFSISGGAWMSVCD